MPAISGAQGARAPAVRMPNQMLYLELGGNAGFLSLNLERKLNDVATIRVGTGWWYIPSSIAFGDQPGRMTQRAVLRPLTVNLMPRLFPGSAHRLETGAGFVFGRRTDQGTPRREANAITGMVGYRWMARPGLFRIGVYYNRGLSHLYPSDGFRPSLSFGASF